jgi:hypothetical protein
MVKPEATTIITAANTQAGTPMAKRGHGENGLTGGDPVEGGLVASFARPGGNLTGLSIMETELLATRIWSPAEGVGEQFTRSAITPASGTSSDSSSSRLGISS